MKRKRILFSFTLLLLPLLLLLKTATANATVFIFDSGFSPKKLTIEVGDRVIFKNLGQDTHWVASDPHPIHTNYDGFDSKPIPTSKSYEYLFNKKGDWTFHDHLEPEKTGEIVVLDSGNYKLTFFFSRLWTPVVNLKHIVSQKLGSLFKQDSTNSKSISELPTINLDEEYKKTEYKCHETDFACADKFLKEFTFKYGPFYAVDLLSMLVDDGKISKGIDIHQLAHEIGKETETIFGQNPEVFMMCPMTVLGEGCQHGYIESLMMKTGSIEKAIELLCNSYENKKSTGRPMFNCYHGAGHGIMMAEAYDLDKAISICNKLTVNQWLDGCWGGVFMENIYSYQAGKTRPDIFSSTNPLEPCSSIEDRYKKMCYLAHGTYMLSYFETIEKAGEGCLAADDFMDECAFSLGNYALSFEWLRNEFGVNKYEETPKKAIEICDSFPQQITDDCFRGAIADAFFRDFPETARVTQLCVGQTTWSKHECFHEIGTSIKGKVPEATEKVEICSSVPSQFKTDCYTGAEIDTGKM